MVSAAMSPLVVATPTVAPSATAAPQAQPGHFAKELSRHTQDAPPKHEAAPTEKTKAAAADGAAKSPQAPPTRARETPRGAGKAAKSEASTQDAKKSDAAATDDEHIAQDEHAPDANAAADLSAWIATLNGPAAPPLSSGGAVSEQAGDAQAEIAGAAQRFPLADAAIAVAKDDSPARPERSASGFATALAARTQDAPLSAAHDKNAVPDLAHKLAEPGTTALPQAPALQAAAAPAAPAHTEAAPMTASIAAHTHSDEFAPAIAAQVSILARDGVHEAQLHLNPAETGPIAVRIEVVAAQAHIDFSAEQAATRSAIEASLPDLAAALRDAGLTLAGGGVFQQSARQQQREGDERGTRVAGSRRSAAAEPPTPNGPVRRTVRAGGLDLYA